MLRETESIDDSNHHNDWKDQTAASYKFWDSSAIIHWRIQTYTIDSYASVKIFDSVTIFAVAWASVVVRRIKGVSMERVKLSDAILCLNVAMHHSSSCRFSTFWIFNSSCVSRAYSMTRVSVVRHCRCPWSLSEERVFSGTYDHIREMSLSSFFFTFHVIYYRLLMTCFSFSLTWF